MKDKKPVLENKYINIDGTDIVTVVSALKRKQLAGTAQVVEEYEQKLADAFSVKHALAVSSGTAALHLLLYLYDVKAGDEVIVPPTAPIMSALPILAVDAVPVFVDVLPDTFTFDAEDLKRKITPRTKAIVSVPMWGYPTDLTETKAIATEHKIPLIEDASHCHGSKYRSNLVGTTGDVGFFSTQERKLVTTGEGGFIVTNNTEVANKVREIRDFGKPFRETLELKDHLGQYGYLFGLNFRLNAMSAALGISQLKKMPEKIKARTINANEIKEGLESVAWLREIGVTHDCTPNYYSMVLFVNHPTQSANEIAKHLLTQDIVSDTYRFGIKPLYELPIFAAYKSSCPNSEQILQQIITLPTHEGLDNADILKIVTALKDMDD